MKNLKEWFEEQSLWICILGIVICLIVLAGCIFGCAAVFMLLWNYAIVAALTIAMPIGYWHAVCMVIIPAFICLPVVRKNIK